MVLPKTGITTLQTLQSCDVIGQCLFLCRYDKIHQISIIFDIVYIGFRFNVQPLVATPLETQAVLKQTRLKKLY